MNPGPAQREYHLLRCLGRGGFGEVYLARIRSPEGQFELDAAVKLLHGRLAPDSDAVARLRDEGRLLALVDHPAILGVRDMLVLDGRIALVTEYVDGQDLSAFLRDPDTRLPLRVLLDVVGVVADALHAARTAPGRDGRPLQIVHRDIKPSNIRISRHGAVKLLDFGIARSDATAREAATATDTILGSLPYMAPERFDSNNTDPASDVYALGCVLYEGLANRLLFDQPLPVMVGIAHASDRHAAHVTKRADSLGAAAPEVLELMRTMLRHDPSARPNARMVSDRCDALAQATPGPTLRAWARDRAWPEATEVDAELAGQVLTEGAATLRADEVSSAATVAAATRAHEPEPRGWGAVVGALVGFGGLAGVVAVGLAVLVGSIVVVGVMRSRAAGQDATPASPAAAVPEAEEPDARSLELHPEAPPVAAPSVEAPVAEAPVLAAKVVAVAPIRLADVRPADPPSPTTPRTTGTVAASGVWKVTLRGVDGAYPVGEVPAGTYTMVAEFPTGTKDAGTVVVRAGDRLAVKCNPTGENCWVVE